MSDVNVRVSQLTVSNSPGDQDHRRVTSALNQGAQLPPLHDGVTVPAAALCDEPAAPGPSARAGDGESDRRGRAEPAGHHVPRTSPSRRSVSASRPLLANASSRSAPAPYATDLGSPSARLAPGAGSSTVRVGVAPSRMKRPSGTAS